MSQALRPRSGSTVRPTNRRREEEEDATDDDDPQLGLGLVQAEDCSAGRCHGVSVPDAGGSKLYAERCMLYAVLDAARVTGDWRYLPAHSVCCAFASPAGPCANELGECGRRRPYIALGRICTLQYRCLRGLNSTRGHVSNRSTLPGKREGSA